MYELAKKERETINCAIKASKRLFASLATVKLHPDGKHPSKDF